MMMTVLHPTDYSPAKFRFSRNPTPLLSSTTLKLTIPTPTSNHKTVFKLYCSSNEEQKQQTLKGFSALELDPPWESGNVWSTMALYFFSLHIPLSFGGLYFVADLLHQPHLEPQTKAFAILVIQTLELLGAVLLLQFTAKPNAKPVSLFKNNILPIERNWVSTALLGFVAIVAAMILSSILADKLFQNEGVNDQIVKEILLSGSVGQTACILAYCVIGPLLEEIVYRRFFLASLAPNMPWNQAVVVSSVIFSAAHLSIENFIQLFIIGVVLGCSYCWSGDLRSSTLLHSMYNALTLFIIVSV